jgi:hypothetical protein
MKTYIVTVIKTESYTVDIEIKAPSMAQAESMAVDDAQTKKQDWSYDETEFLSFAEEVYE